MKMIQVAVLKVRSTIISRTTRTTRNIPMRTTITKKWKRMRRNLKKQMMVKESKKKKASMIFLTSSMKLGFSFPPTMMIATTPLIMTLWNMNINRF